MDYLSANVKGKFMYNMYIRTLRLAILRLVNFFKDLDYVSANLSTICTLELMYIELS